LSREKAIAKLKNARKHLRTAETRLDTVEGRIYAIRKNRDNAERLINEALKELEEEDPPKLAVRNNQIYFRNRGTIPFYGSGVSRRGILNRANGDWYSLYGRPLEFFLELSIEYGLNYERVNATRNIDLLRGYFQSRREAGIVVELTLTERVGNTLLDIFGDPKEVIAQTKDFKDIIIYDPVNEFYCQADVDLAWFYCKYLKDRGLISSAGAYGSGAEGWSETFDPVRSSNRIIGIHRYYGDIEEVKKTVYPYRNSGKPMIWTESFRIAAERWRQLAGWFKHEGVSCFNYYGLRSRELFPDLKHEDPNPWRKYYEEAEKLCQELNQ